MIKRIRKTKLSKTKKEKVKTKSKKSQSPGGLSPTEKKGEDIDEAGLSQIKDNENTSGFVILMFYFDIVF
jgi:hypothetical protein